MDAHYACGLGCKVWLVYCFAIGEYTRILIIQGGWWEGSCAGGMVYKAVIDILTSHYVILWIISGAMLRYSSVLDLLQNELVTQNYGYAT